MDDGRYEMMIVHTLVGGCRRADNNDDDRVISLLLLLLLLELFVAIGGVIGVNGMLVDGCIGVVAVTCASVARRFDI